MSGRLLGLIPAPLSFTVATFSTALSNVIGYTDVILVHPVGNILYTVCLLQNKSFYFLYLISICVALVVLRVQNTAKAMDF
jgi:hypothetical protein